MFKFKWDSKLMIIIKKSGVRKNQLYLFLNLHFKYTKQTKYYGPFCINNIFRYIVNQLIEAIKNMFLIRYYVKASSIFFQCGDNIQQNNIAFYKAALFLLMRLDIFLLHNKTFTKPIMRIRPYRTYPWQGKVELILYPWNHYHKINYKFSGP